MVKAGCGISFFLTALSFVWAIWVLFQWKRPSQRAAVHGEEMWSAIRSGFSYTIHSPANRAILLRVLTPSSVRGRRHVVAGSDHRHAIATFGKRRARKKGAALLFAFVGLGAILGVLLMPGLQNASRSTPVVNVCTGCFAAGLIILSQIHQMGYAAAGDDFPRHQLGHHSHKFQHRHAKIRAAMGEGAGDIVIFISPCSSGHLTIGAGIWGKCEQGGAFNAANYSGVTVSLLTGGISMAAFLVLAKWFPLTLNEGLDLNSAFAGAPPEPVFPAMLAPVDPIAGPIPGAPVARRRIHRPGRNFGWHQLSGPQAQPALTGPVEVSLALSRDELVTALRNFCLGA